VIAVKNGLNFCIFVEQQTGFTFQLGAENLASSSSEAQVSLTELKEAAFYS